MSDDLRKDLTDGLEVNWDAGRRTFLRTCGFAVAGAAALGVAGRPTAAAAQAVTDVDVLNFALNLEYLEAEFYLRATRGTGLSDDDVTGTGSQGSVIGGSKVKFDTKAFRLYGEEIAADELAHVRFLRSALGTAAVARPKINLKASFTAAAKAAGLIKGDAEFDAFANETNFLLASFIFEDVGVTAYKGAARLIENKDYLEAAAGILAVEAYHAGIIRTILYSLGLFSQTKAISDLRDSADGDADLDQGIGGSKSANLVPTDNNGLVFSRSVPQVRAIAYLSPTADRGGFFPNGLNGAFGPSAS